MSDDKLRAAAERVVADWVNGAMTGPAIQALKDLIDVRPGACLVHGAAMCEPCYLIAQRKVRLDAARELREWADELRGMSRTLAQETSWGSSADSLMNQSVVVRECAVRLENRAEMM